MKNIAILGSTGSIGTQALEVVENNRDELKVTVLAVMSSIDLLFKQILKYRPDMVCVYDEESANELYVKLKISGIKCQVLSGMDGLVACAEYEKNDIVLSSVVGMIGIRPAIAAINAGKDLALANKETLVCAGHIIMPLAKEKNVKIYPVDSEHSAIFQSLNGERENEISRILLTASGGPFRGMSRRELENVSVERALRHPNWSMGRKITIDSATMVNKGLEVMEAAWLFDTDCDKICVMVHPESIVHSMVEYMDGAVIAQLGVPDMKLPIQYALFYPKRKFMPYERLNLFKAGKLTFEEPDMETFKGLKMAYDVMKEGGIMPTVYNAANEKAVALFLDGKVGFLEIADTIEKCILHFDNVTSPDVATILETEQKVYEYMSQLN